jgi:Histidine kinase-, DNA gyrase B-, and HSP90-like ATPase
MSKVHVVAKRDFLESLTMARPLAGLAELVWNGFDAGSDRVEVHLDMNGLGGIDSIRVRDYGQGINHEQVENLFGSLGDSWKKNKTRQNGRALHGKSGKGRFRAFALGTMVDWNTTYRSADKKSHSYRIRGEAISLDDFEIYDPIDANGTPTGTEVVISNLKHDFGSLINDTAPRELAKLFAAYLTEYPSLMLEYNGVRIDPKEAQLHSKDYPLGEVALGDNRTATVTVSVVEWNIPTERTLHLCDASGVALHETLAGQQIRAPGFNFTAYVKSDHFRELDKENKLMLEDLHPDVDAIVKAAKGKIKEHFRRRVLENQGKIIERWKKEQIYPYDDKQTVDPVEEAERQVFDILAVNVESYLPSFEEADTKSKKFTFRLLAQAISENPESVQKIIGDVLGLKKEAQDELAELLRSTPLSSIISSAKIVANRLDFLHGLEMLLFPPENKKRLLERDQLHKILENEAWLFHEEFGLAGSEERLEEVLQIHLDKLGKREDNPEPVKLSDGKTGR